MERWSIWQRWNYFLHRAKFRQSYVLRHILEDDAHRHSDPHLLPRTLDHVANHRYLIVGAVERNMRDDIGDIVLESGNRHIVHYNERIHGASLAKLRPVEFPRIAMGTKGLGRPTKFSAIAATLSRKLVHFAAVPERLGVQIRHR